MARTNKSKRDDCSNPTHGQQRPRIDSPFRLIVVAALRSKQLVNGSAARIESHPLRRRNTSIALEEVKRGLVNFTTRNGEEL